MKILKIIIKLYKKGYINKKNKKIKQNEIWINEGSDSLKIQN